MYIRLPLTVGSGGGATIGIVTKLVDVHATLSIGVVASDIPCNGSWGGFRFLLEGNGAGNLRVTSEGCNYNRIIRSARAKEIHRATRTKRVIWDYMLVRKWLRFCLSGLRMLH